MHRPHSYFLLLIIIFAGGHLQNILWGAELQKAESPLFHEATNEFQTMKTTIYQYQIRVDRVSGSYRYDCVGFISYALEQAAPEAWAEIMKTTGTVKGRIPNPIKFRTFLDDLAKTNHPGWKPVTKASELRPGDVVAWEHKTETAIGHAVIIGSIPVAEPDGSWLVEVYDSTSFPHGDDSRPEDPRAQKMESNNRRSGLGRGKMILTTDPINGVLTGLRWSPKAKIVTVPIAAGRPVS